MTKRVKGKRPSPVQLAARRREVLRRATEGESCVEIARSLDLHHSQVSRDLKRSLAVASAEDAELAGKYRALHVRRLERLFQMAATKAGESTAWHERACAALAGLAKVNGLHTDEAMRRAGRGAVTVNVINEAPVEIQSVLPPGCTTEKDYPWLLEPDLKKANEIKEAHRPDNANGRALPAPLEIEQQGDSPGL